MDKEKIGAFILENRKALGMTQEDLAQKVFVTNKAVSKWEKGQSFPDIALFEPLAKALEVSTSELIAGKKEASPEATVKELAKEIFRKEKVKILLEGIIFLLAVTLFIGGIYFFNYLEDENFDYVCINGFYYHYYLDKPLNDKTLAGEFIGEVRRTGKKRDIEFNRHGDSNVYPVGAKIYAVNEEHPVYKHYAGGEKMIIEGEEVELGTAWPTGSSFIEINGEYYYGNWRPTNVRESDMYSFSHGRPVGYLISWGDKTY